MKNIASLLLVLMCSFSSVAQDKNIDSSQLLGCWTDSREENKSDNIQVYRPCDYKDFAPSRFRFEMELLDDGKCKFLLLAPNDAHQMVSGTWTFNSQTGVLKLSDVSNKSKMVLIVTQAEDNMLGLTMAQ